MPKFLSNVDFNQNQLVKPRVENLASEPANPVAGQMYFNTGSKRLFVYNGTGWTGADANDCAVTDGSITNAKLAEMPKQTIKGNKTDAAAGAADLSASEVKTLLGLNNVTNDAQMKKAASSVSGAIARWDGTNGDKLMSEGFYIEESLSGWQNALATAYAVKQYVDGKIAAAEAMVFKGTVGSEGTYTVANFNSLKVYGLGWTFKVISAGTIKGHVCEVGDMLISTAAREADGVNSDWAVVQSNIDGAVTGPAAAVSVGNVPVWSDSAGRTIGGGYGVQSSLSSSEGHIATSKSIVTYLDATHTKKFAADLGAGSSQSIKHSLGTRDVSVLIRETAGNYAQVMADVEITDEDNVTVKFAAAPSAGQYRIVVVG